MYVELRKRLPDPIRRSLRRIKAEVLSFGLPRRGIFDQPASEVEASEEMSVIVAVKDAPEMTHRCLASLGQYAPQSQVIIVDDGSVLPRTLEIIGDFRARKGWMVVRHSESRGHSRSCEAGARLATRPYLCFLNSDTVVTPWSWLGAKYAFASDPRIGVTGPSTSLSGGQQTIPIAHYCRGYWNDAQIYGFALRLIATCGASSWVDLPWVGGFAFFIRRSLWEALGGFDPSLPDYGNEVELCKRVSKTGLRIVWTRNSYIHHFGAQSYGRNGEEFLTLRRQLARRHIEEKHGSF